MPTWTCMASEASAWAGMMHCHNQTLPPFFRPRQHRCSSECLQAGSECQGFEHAHHGTTRECLQAGSECQGLEHKHHGTISESSVGVGSQPA
eukprot:1160524-Pelagomonas_calceolata.AAC.9